MKASERLLHLADALDIMPIPDQFNLESFAGFVDAEGAYMDWRKDHPPCGTVLCACGYAALLPVLQAEGLVLKAFMWPTGTHSRIDTALNTVDEFNATLTNDELTTFELQYADNCGIAAAGVFFGLDSDEFMDLFTDSAYIGNPPPSQVAERIRALVYKWDNPES